MQPKLPVSFDTRWASALALRSSDRLGHRSIPTLDTGSDFIPGLDAHAVVGVPLEEGEGADMVVLLIVVAHA